jgi:hypothetical protein
MKSAAFWGRTEGKKRFASCYALIHFLKNPKLVSSGEPKNSYATTIFSLDRLTAGVLV